MDKRLVKVVAEDGPRAQKVGIRAGHGGREDPREEQSHDDRGHGGHGQVRQGVLGPLAQDEAGIYFVHVEQSQGDDAQQSWDKGVDEIDDCGDDGALPCGPPVPGRVVAGNSLLSHGEGGDVHDHERRDLIGTDPLEEAESPIRDVGDDIIHSPGHAERVGQGRGHSEEDQEDLHEIGQGDAPEPAHDRVDGDDQGDGEHRHPVVEPKHDGDDGGGCDELRRRQANQRQDHDDGRDGAGERPVSSAEVLWNGLDLGSPELVGEEG